MKNVSIIFTIGILLVGSTVLTSTSKNLITEASAYPMTEEQVQAKITHIIENHPKFASIVEGISDLDLKETVKGYLASEVLQKMLKYHAKSLIDDKMSNQTGMAMKGMMTEEEKQAKITQFKENHPKFASIVEGISDLDLKETVKGYLAAGILEKVFKHHVKALVEEKVEAVN